jgi:flagellar basal-body rod modification protein FlgD
MDITTTPPPPATPPATAGRPGLASDYMTFLRMLTTQMRNQDPLNPMSASDFAVQLATFAGVEQATQTNQLLSALLARSGLAQMGSWVGMEARVLSGAWFDGAPVDLAPDPAAGAQRAMLVVRDAGGAIVDSRPHDPAVQSASWDGRRADGRTLPAGRYSFELESWRGEDLLANGPVAAYQPIREARVEGGRTLLVLPGGMMVDAEQIGGLRQPPG